MAVLVETVAVAVLVETVLAAVLALIAEANVRCCTAVEVVEVPHSSTVRYASCDTLQSDAPLVTLLWHAQVHDALEQSTHLGWVHFLATRCSLCLCSHTRFVSSGLGLRKHELGPTARFCIVGVGCGHRGASVIRCVSVARAVSHPAPFALLHLGLGSAPIDATPLNRGRRRSSSSDAAAGVGRARMCRGQPVNGAKHVATARAWVGQEVENTARVAVVAHCK